jgi:hypothetical protein
MYTKAIGSNAWIAFEKTPAKLSSGQREARLVSRVLSPHPPATRTPSVVELTAVPRTREFVPESAALSASGFL